MNVVCIGIAASTTQGPKDAKGTVANRKRRNLEKQSLVSQVCNGEDIRGKTEDFYRI